LGKGATFIVQLPVLTAPPENRPQAVAIDTAPPLRILLIDDSEDTLTSMQMLLASAGHEVESASDSQAGLRAAVDRPPDVAVIDIGMPGMDGYQVAREIRRQCDQQIFLIALTGYGQPEDVRRAVAAGFDAHQVKPVQISTLNALLSKLNRRAASA
jgi:CheY-like chemotaxis protein